MKHYEYKAVPAPTQGRKAKGVKTTAERFALAFSELLNEMADEGWTYVRSETLPCDERRGLTGTQTTFQSLLIFSRALPDHRVAAPHVAPTLVRLEPAGLADHEDADPVSAALGDTLRATREVDAPPRRLGSPRDDD